MRKHNIQILQAAIPHLHMGLQPMARCLLSFLELQDSLQGAFSSPPFPFGSMSAIQDRSSLLEALRPIVNEQEQSLINQMQSMENMMQFFRIFQAMNAANSGANGSDPFSMLDGLLTPEQQSTFAFMKAMMEEGE